MQIVNRSRQLVCNAAGELLANYKFSLVQKRKEVTAIEHFHHDVNRVLVLENVIEFYNVGVLADLKHLNLSLEQFKIFERELFLFDDFDCTFLVGFLVNCRLYQSILALAQVVT